MLEAQDKFIVDLLFKFATERRTSVPAELHEGKVLWTTQWVVFRSSDFTTFAQAAGEYRARGNIMALAKHLGVTGGKNVHVGGAQVRAFQISVQRLEALAKASAFQVDDTEAALIYSLYAKAAKLTVETGEQHWPQYSGRGRWEIVPSTKWKGSFIDDPLLREREGRSRAVVGTIMRGTSFPS